MTGNADDKILLAVTGWDPEIWRSEFAKAASGRKLVLDADTDKENIRYALVWKQRQGSLAGRLARN